MQITDIRIRRLTRVNKMLAVVSIAFNNVFVTHDIKVIEGEHGPFIAMPSKQVQRLRNKSAITPNS